MKVLMFAPDGQGDVQPFVALGKRLNEAGHESIFVASAPWARFAESYGINTVPLTDWHRAAPRVPASRGASSLLFSRLRILRALIYFTSHARRFKKFKKQRLDELAEVGSCGADVIVHHVFLPGHEIAERYGIPAVPVCLVPCWVPTSRFPNPWFSFVPTFLNRASYRICLPRWASEFGLTQWRRETLCLPDRRGHQNVLRRPDGSPATVLQALSSHILPSGLDYPDEVHTTGFWFLPAEPDSMPPAALLDFIRAGDPPVCISFGSAVGSDPRQSARIVTDAVRRAGVRAVVAGGSGGISPDELGGEIFYARQVPFDWLFPQAAAIVHHGGMGTAALALAAGRPQVICPFHPGQRFTAQRMRALGVATEPLSQQRLTATGLAERIRRAVTDASIAASTKRVAPQVREEDGLDTAVRVLESLA